jgi:peptidoglycan/LPS O-acetylase OafA/YrhL
VVVSHFGGPALDRANGYYAVQGFFVISGFLMTAILNGSYADRPGAFWLNRFLKLFPIYYAVCVATLGAIAVMPSAASTYSGGWTLSWSLQTIIAEFTVVPLAFNVGPEWRLVPPMWTVAIEIVNYAIIFAWSARGWKWALTALLVGLVYQIDCIAQQGSDVGSRYGSWIAGMVPFSAGSLAYFATVKIKAPNWLSFVGLAAWSANLLAADTTGNGYLFGVVLWFGNTITAAVLVAAIGPQHASPAVKSADRLVGDLAYPVFLVHLLVGFFVRQALPDAPMGPRFLALCSPAVLLASAALAQLARMILEPTRDRVRQA